MNSASLMPPISSTPLAPDFAERRRALDPEHSFIVQAPAGSGKTGLLIQRYLTLLAAVNEPEEIVAITFTRKAAAEMRERVIAALAQAGNTLNSSTTSESSHEKLTFALADAVLRRDIQAGWNIAGNPARLRIQTLDSLCASLTRQMPMLSKFGSQPESIEDASDLYLEAARATIDLVDEDDTVAQDIQRLLEHLDNDVARVETLLAEMLARRDQWLRHIHGKDREELEGALGNARHEALDRLCGLFRLHVTSTQDELIALAAYAASNLSAASGKMPSVADEGRGACSALPGDAEQDVAGWHAVADLLLTKKEGNWRKQHTVSDGFPSGNTRAEKVVAKSWKERALALIDLLAKNDGDTLRQALHAIRRLPPLTYTEKQWEVLGSITRLLPRAVGQLKLVFQSHNKVDFTEVAQAALRALGEPEMPTDLALALDYRIRHLLIDEFQDTSISQYELVAKLTAGWEPGDGRSLLVVGDPMQSIYRFREAEVGLFLRARTLGIGNITLHPLSLCANFRSQRGIVEWINATFAQVMPERENIALGAVSYTQSVATHDLLPGAAVSVHPFFNNDHAAEAVKVVEIVLQTRQDDPSGTTTTAILVRNRSHLHEIIPRLKEVGIRFRAIEIEGLGRRPVVQDLLALTRALAHPADRLAWLALLRGPWCGLTLADIHALVSTHGASVPGDTDDAVAMDKEGRSAGENNRTVWELLNDDTRMAMVSTDGYSRLLRVREVLKDCIDNRCRQSFRATVEAAWLALGGPGCVEDATDLEDAAVYLDYLEAHEVAGSIPKLAALEEGLTGLYALPDLEADATLQIMTIHKAKGLEFDCVIVPGLGRPSRSNDKRLFMWMEHPRATLSVGERNAANDLLLAPIQETGAESDPIYSWLEKLEGEKERFEDERLLYVAATRAKQRLHLLGATGLVSGSDGAFELRSPAGKSLLSKLWAVVQPVYAEAAARKNSSNISFIADGEQNREGEKHLIDRSLRRLISGWALPAAPPPMRWSAPHCATSVQGEIEYSWAGETARRIGSVVHRWLQRIAEDGVKNWSVARIQLLRDTFGYQLVACGMDSSHGDISAATRRVMTALTHAVSDMRGQWLLGPQQDVHNELRMTAVIGGKPMDLVIDRTFRDANGQCWVVDYKTSSHEGTDVEGFLDREQERYRFQLDRYAALMRLIDGQPVKRGLYFPLLKGWREWGDEESSDGKVENVGAKWNH
ncbi:ATP-dependent exoDNAse (exonuclease V) beta subunit (contains helicase and exonuclease domains) [Nitrosospira sp. Nl5]|uniref:UvrD-helicase domain-containing protein n=1 Tax=Nitrosospira sp. Nl5 TaxID=200120 RepID=UPI000881C77E|nr:UvrD-helicase domain-containing protein [Nitrosospira sp. Nl5]SCY48942.1 ATP-dependent exoDNAse (exonuclease V) beta subunit (contains helicase and exonuclease domains) [Nitrosospira sp. Nl5]